MERPTRLLPVLRTFPQLFVRSLRVLVVVGEEGSEKFHRKTLDGAHRGVWGLRRGGYRRWCRKCRYDLISLNKCSDRGGNLKIEEFPSLAQDY